MFYEFYHEYDYDILNKMIDKCFDFKMKYMPTFAELNNYLEDVLIGRIFEIVNIMHDKGFYRIGATGTPDEIIIDIFTNGKTYAIITHRLRDILIKSLSIK